MSAPVTARDLRKQFGDVPAVAGVSFTIPAGRILALIGPSGCARRAS